MVALVCTGVSNLGANFCLKIVLCPTHFQNNLSRASALAPQASGVNEVMSKGLENNKANYFWHWFVYLSLYLGLCILVICSYEYDMNQCHEFQC